MENDLQELRGDLRSWLVTQADDPPPPAHDDPFAYAIGGRQMRFGDDFDHERMAKYEVRHTVIPRYERA